MPEDLELFAGKVSNCHPAARGVHVDPTFFKQHLTYLFTAVQERNYHIFYQLCMASSKAISVGVSLAAKMIS